MIQFKSPARRVHYAAAMGSEYHKSGTDVAKGLR
jgi:hypothetical protein